MLGILALVVLMAVDLGGWLYALYVLSGKGDK